MQDETVNAVQALLAQDTHARFTQTHVQQWLNDDNFVVIMEEQAGQLIGFAVTQCAADTADLLYVTTHPDCRRQGIAQQLLLDLADYLREENVAQWLLEVRVSNVAAQQLYAQVGFEQVSTRKQYYPSSDGREDALVMNKRLL